MPDKSDQTLLEEFARTGSPAAIDTLVRRHGNWIYATSLRFVHDAELAQDVTQSVFLIFLKKAANMNPRQRLAGWFFNTCKYASANALRMQRRRKLHERAAAQSIVENLDLPADAVDYQAISAFLNSGLSRLNTPDREAILIRYFREGSNADVAAVLNISEPAARVRVSRALTRLRQILTRHEKGLTEASLTTAIAALALPSADMSSALASVISNPVAFNARAVSIAQGANTMMLLIRAKFVAGIVTAILLGVGAITVIAQLSDLSRSSTTQNLPALAEFPSGIVPGTIDRQIPLTKDTMILKYMPDWSHGEVDNIAVADNDGGVRTLVDWPPITQADLRSPLTKVYIALYSRKTTIIGRPSQLGAFEILQDWDETHTPWNKQSPSADKPAALYDFVPGDGWKVFDITSLIRAQLNADRQSHGIVLQFQAEDRSGERRNWSGYEFVSREAVDHFQPLRPRLLVVTNDGM